MSDKKSTLLSIIIPTKNRQYTCLYAIESVLLIQSDLLEVVIQDCSDSDKLRAEIVSKFNNDNRIKYFYTGSSPSMTENWNCALTNATGKYICVIGDDDAVLPACLEVTRWMNSNSIQALLGADVKYCWKDATIDAYTNRRLSHNMHYSGDIYEVDTQKEFMNKVIHCGFGYTEDLANLYHGIIEKELLEIHKNNCGYYLSGTSVDVYNAIVLPSYIKKSYYLDYPLTVKGASGSSNSNRSYYKKDFKNHFNEYKNFQIPEILPKTLSAEVSITESTITALRDTKQEGMILNMNLALVYAKCAATDLMKLFNYFNQYKKRKNSNNTLSDFFLYFWIFSRERIKSFMKGLVLKTLFRIAPVNTAKYLEKYTDKRRIIADDILSANKMLLEHLETNSMSIKYHGKIKLLTSKKMPWS